MVYLTGDTHGTHDIEKLFPDFFPDKNMTKDDYVIILGDFGFIWTLEADQHERHWLNWFDDLPWTTLFIDGNHENHPRLATFPIENWHGGQVHRISNSVYHLMRGQVFDIDGNTFFTMGGANSIDKMYRRPGISWWPEELPSEEEFAIAIKNLETHDWTVDYVLTHELPTKQLLELNHSYESYLLTDWLNGIRKRLNYKHWYCGHHHINRALSDNIEVLYNHVVPLKRHEYSELLIDKAQLAVAEAEQEGWIPEEEILQELQLSAASTRPFSDIIEKYDEVSEYVNSTNEPIFLMKDGQVDLVVLSLETFANLSFYEDIAEIPPDTPCTSATL